MNNLTKHTPEEINQFARTWIDECGDSAIIRMYGHHMRSFIAGFEIASKELLEENESLKQANKELLEACESILRIKNLIIADDEWYNMPEHQGEGEAIYTAFQKIESAISKHKSL